MLCPLSGHASELRSCVKVEVAVPHKPSLISKPYGFCGRKAPWKKERKATHALVAHSRSPVLWQMRSAAPARGTPALLFFAVATCRNDRWLVGSAFHPAPTLLFPHLGGDGDGEGVIWVRPTHVPLLMTTRDTDGGGGGGGGGGAVLIPYWLIPIYFVLFLLLFLFPFPLLVCYPIQPHHPRPTLTPSPFPHFFLTHILLAHLPPCNKTISRVRLLLSNLHIQWKKALDEEGLPLA